MNVIPLILVKMNKQKGQPLKFIFQGQAMTGYYSGHDLQSNRIIARVPELDSGEYKRAVEIWLPPAKIKLSDLLVNFSDEGAQRKPVDLRPYEPYVNYSV